MTDILIIITPIFLVMAAGYASVRLGLVEKTSTDALGWFVLYLALPALIVMALAGSKLEDTIEPLFFVAYGGGTLLTYGLMFALCKGGMGNTVSLAGVKSLGACFPNSAFVGYSLLLQAFDDPPMTSFAMVMMFENVVMMPLVLSVLEWGAGQHNSALPAATARMIAKRIITNPVIIAIAVGLAFAALDIRLPVVIGASLELLGKAAVGVALICVGGSLVGNAIHSNMADISQIAAVKLLVHPLLVLGLVMILPAFEPDLQHAAVLFAACPMLSIFPILSSKYGFRQLASGALLITTTLSFATISIILTLL